MKFKKALVHFQIVVVTILICFCVNATAENNVWDFTKSFGFRCTGQTGIDTAIRLNPNNEIECWSENGKECIWGLNTDAKCLEIVKKENLSKLQTLECGINHKKLFGVTGYDKPGHWCQRGLKFYFEKYHCPSKTNIKVAFKMNKETGEIQCLSKDYKTCYDGKDLEEVCGNTNQCINHKNSAKKRLLIQTLNPPPALGKIGCVDNFIEEKGQPGYQLNGTNWCKKSLAYFRFNGNWLVASQTGLDQIIRLNKLGDTECLSKEGQDCIIVKGGDSEMANSISLFTNNGANDAPTSVLCTADNFLDKKHWCYKAQFPVMGKSVPDKFGPKDLEVAHPKEEKKDDKKDSKKDDKKDDKKEDKKEDKIDPTDIPWRDTVFGKDKDGFNKNDGSKHWRNEGFDQPKEEPKKSPEPVVKGDEERIKNPGWRGYNEDELGLKPNVKKKEDVTGKTWRNGPYNKEDVAIAKKREDEDKKKLDELKGKKEPEEKWRDSNEMYKPDGPKPKASKSPKDSPPPPREGYKGKWIPLMKNIEMYSKRGESIGNGSRIKIKHILTRNNLHSHGLNYNTGSRQQEVTAFWNLDDNDWWIVKGGKQIKSGDIIQLTHLKTGRNLHSHNLLAPVTRSQHEVSAYGQNGRGDSNDNWRLIITQSYLWDNQEWKVGDLIRLVHVNTGGFLHSHNVRTIVSKQQEVTTFKGDDMNNDWVVFEKFKN